MQTHIARRSHAYMMTGDSVWATSDGGAVREKEHRNGKKEGPYYLHTLFMECVILHRDLSGCLKVRDTHTQQYTTHGH